MITNPELREDEENLDIQAFLESGETFEQLVEQASVIREKYQERRLGIGWIYWIGTGNYPDEPGGVQKKGGLRTT